MTGIILLDFSKAFNKVNHEYFFLKSFVKVELSYVVTITLISKAENCMEK